MSIKETGPAPGAGTLQLLRSEIALYQALADVRRARNDLNDAKLQAWFENRTKVTSTREFEELWLKANPPGIYESLDKRERDVKAEIAKVEKVLDHLKFAGLGGDPNAKAA